MQRSILAGAMLLWAAPLAGAPRIDSVSVKILAGKGNDVVIAVSIERPTLLDLACDATIDAGDGARIPISWSMGDSRTKTTRYEYKRPGSYRVKVAGTGKDACVGLKEATVNVGAPNRADAKPMVTPRCPGGWTLVEESVDGARYTCRPRAPAQSLRCAEGTSYFSERGEIGCR
jgi:hypothetical protein